MTRRGTPPRDYYETLGVLPTSKPSDITAAYYELARKFHPDVGMTDAESLARFKLVSEAYEVLPDEHRRRAYDRQCPPRPADDSSVAFASPAKTAYPSSRPSPHGAPPAPGDIEVELPISPEEAVHGGPCEFTLNVPVVCALCDGRTKTAKSSCDVCQGAGTIQQRRRLWVTLPRGAASGTVIRIPGYGKGALAHGDLLLRLRIQPSW